LARTAAVELCFIFLIGFLCYLVTLPWPDSISIGRFVLSMAVLFLVQTLLRDLWLLGQQKSANGARRNQERAAFCVESAVGISAVVAGCGLLFLSTPITVSLSSPGWSIAVFSTLLLCFLLRDYVIQWRPWRVYKEPDHINIVVRW